VDVLTADLRSLLIAAAESPPDRRDQWVEPVARHGDRAIRELARWLDDRDLRDFALTTILRAGELGWAAAAEDALNEALHDGTSAPKRPSPGHAKVDGLVRGQLYRRTALHESGLGGNRQTGISYPAHGDHALLLPTVGGRETYGYHDRWDGDDFIYYGEWKGTPEMAMTGGNAAIVDRSPNLYLFTGQGHGVYRFEGQFEYLTHTTEWTERAGNVQRAIVFRLRRVSASVEL
jgi:hypothetical protein